MTLSILIPTCNDSCIGLVQALQAQAETLGGSYEIVVADDGSTDEMVLAGNAPIASLPHCRYIRREQNTGRAAIRNFLAKEAQYEHLLFIDSDMTVCRQTSSTAVSPFPSLNREGQGMGLPLSVMPTSVQQKMSIRWRSAASIPTATSIRRTS